MEEYTMKRMTKILSLALALCMLLAVSAFASGEPSAEAAAGVVPGTYVDGANTLVIADDMTFTMETVGENMDGAAFALTVTGTVDAAGNFTITGLFDGDFDLVSLATEEQLAGNLATVQATYAAAAGAVGIVPGSYTDGVCTLVIADDMTFSLEKTGTNMDGAEFVLIVTGVVEDGAFVIDGLWDGEINLIEMATEDQIAEDLASVESAYAAGAASAGAAADPVAAYAEYIHEWLLAEDAVNDTMTSDIVENEFMPLVEAGDYTTFPAEMLWNGMLNNGSPMTFEEWSAQ